MIIFHYKYCHVLFLPIFLLFSGCTYKEEFTPKTREKKTIHYTQLGLAIPDKNVSIVNDIDPNALTGMGYGAKSCMQTPSSLHYILPGLDILVSAVCMPFGITFGTLGGFAESHNLEKLKEEDGGLQAGIGVVELYDKVQNIILTYTNENGLDIVGINTVITSIDKNQTINYSSLVSKGIDTILEFQIDKIELDEKSLVGIPVEIYLQVSANLLRASDNTVLDTDKKEIKSKHPYKQWVENDFELLNKEFNEMLETATKSIIDDLLFLYYPTFPEELSVTERTTPFYVLKPYYPEVTFEHFSNDEVILGSSHVFTEIHEQQPELHWESFPWKYDAVPQERFSDIVYDLEIYDFKTGDQVYERKGLKTNTHHVEIRLKRETKYLWRVRARFLLDSKPRFTEWSGVYQNSIGDIPVWRFGTDKSFGAYRWRTLQNKKYFSYAFIIEED